MSRFIHAAKFVLVFLAASAGASATHAQITAPTVYAMIQVQGEDPGTEFDEWGAIPIADVDLMDNPGDVDLSNIQIANDENFIYIHATLHNIDPISMAQVFLAFDTDQDVATGFDVFQVGEIGSEVGYQTDFPFAQDEGIFNLNIAFTGGPIGNGGALIYPFHSEAGPPSGTEMEWAVPLEAVIQYPPPLGGPAPAFPNPSFNFAVYTTGGLGDLTSIFSYTLAEPPAGTPGDFDGDEDVDGADFIEWQLGVGTEFDADDLADWRANFGMQAPPVAAIPEPTGALLIALGLMGVARRRR